MTDAVGPYEELEISGDITDHWTYTQVRDYTLLYPSLSHTALRLYLLLRSMISEDKKSRHNKGLRRMTIDQLCWLLPGPNEKPTSVSTMYEVLAQLEQVGLVEPVDVQEMPGAAGLKGKQKAALAIARGFKVRDMPPEIHTGWRNTWDKLDAYTPGWRTDPPQPPTRRTTLSEVYLVNPSEELFQKSGTADEGGNDAPLFQKSGTVFQDSGTPAQISGTDLPLTSENGTPLISLSKKLSLPPVPGAPKRSSRGGHPTKKRESTAAPEGTAAPAEVVDLPAQRVEDDLLVELGQVLTAYEEARGGKTLNGTRQKILIDAAELLAAGRPLAWVIDRAKELPKFGTDLIRHAEMSRVPFTTRPVQQSLGQPVVGCASCHGSGLAEDATGMPMGPCGCITTTTSA